MQTVHKGVTITVTPGSGNEQGFFQLSWPGHPAVDIDSRWKRSEYVMAEAKEIVDAWLAEGYIVLPTAQEEKAMLGFEHIFNSDGSCGVWDCRRPGAILAKNIQEPNYGGWFCVACWERYKELPWLSIVLDRRPYIAPPYQLSTLATSLHGPEMKFSIDIVNICSESEK